MKNNNKNNNASGIISSKITVLFRVSVQVPVLEVSFHRIKKKEENKYWLFNKQQTKQMKEKL